MHSNSDIKLQTALWVPSDKSLAALHPLTLHTDKIRQKQQIISKLDFNYKCVTKSPTVKIFLLDGSGVWGWVGVDVL